MKEITHLENNNRCETCFEEGRKEQIKDELRFLQDYQEYFPYAQKIINRINKLKKELENGN